MHHFNGVKDEQQLEYITSGFSALLWHLTQHASDIWTTNNDFCKFHGLYCSRYYILFINTVHSIGIHYKLLGCFVWSIWEKNLWYRQNCLLWIEFSLTEISVGGVHCINNRFRFAFFVILVRTSDIMHLFT